METKEINQNTSNHLEQVSWNQIYNLKNGTFRCYLKTVFTQDFNFFSTTL